jgi:hypothetical protein
MSNIKTKGQLSGLAKTFVVGTRKHFPNGSQTLQVGNVTYTVDELAAAMQSIVDIHDAVEASKAATKAKLQAEEAKTPSNLALVHAFETMVRGMFGTSADALADFGLSPPKARVPMTTEQKAVAAAKRTATRKARHTMGANQKKGINGNVTASLVVTPASESPPAATTPAAPAPAGAAVPAVVRTT